MAIAQSVRSTLPFEPFDEGSVTRYAPIRVRCRISPFVAVVSKAARGHPGARLGLLARPMSRVKRRNHHRKRWFLEVRVLDFQSLLRDCRNRRRPSGIQVQYSFRTPELKITTLWAHLVLPWIYFWDLFFRAKPSSQPLITPA